MTDFLFVSYDAVAWFLVFLFAFSLLFALALGHLLRQSRINVERLHRELDGHVDENVALRIDEATAAAERTRAEMRLSKASEAWNDELDGYRMQVFIAGEMLRKQEET